MIATASVAAVATGVLAYAVYFDHKRRTSPEFRRSLRRDERRKARDEKDSAAKEQLLMRAQMRSLVHDANAEGYPSDTTEMEAYFLEQVAKGEELAADPNRAIDAALHFYRGLKVYPTPKDLLKIYDQTVPKHVLDLLAEMIAIDPELANISSGQDAPPFPAGLESMFAQAGMDLPPTVGLD